MAAPDVFPSQPGALADVPAVPSHGSLGLLALGAVGLEAWRDVRGTDWIEARRAEFEARGLLTPEPEAPAPDAAHRATPEALAGTHVVVVSGLPRSGTSMLMQMLTAGGLAAFTDGARTPDASNPRGYYEHDRVKALATDTAWVPDADGHVVKVVAPLLPLLPPGPAYRVVLLERALDEVLRSQEAMLASLGHGAAAGNVLRSVFERQLAAAAAWADATPDVALLALGHAEIIADPAAAAARVNAFLGGALDEAAMADAVRPDLHRQRTAS